MAINETINVDIAGLGEVNDLAGCPGPGCHRRRRNWTSSSGRAWICRRAGPGRLVAARDSAISKIRADVDTLNTSVADLGRLAVEGLLRHSWRRLSAPKGQHRRS
jgi:hypothetical protein